MRSLIILLSILGITTISCNSTTKPTYDTTSPQSKIIVDMIDAVNEKDSEKYVRGFADDVQVYVESDMKINGRDVLQTNRANHFEQHPAVRSEIQHMVEIDNRVILHDKVWLDDSDQEGQNIVEIFTFEQGKVSRVDVIQPRDLFKRETASLK